MTMLSRTSTIAGPIKRQYRRASKYAARRVPITQNQKTIPSAAVRGALFVNWASYHSESRPVNFAICGQPRGSPSRRSNKLATASWTGPVRNSREYDDNNISICFCQCRFGRPFRAISLCVALPGLKPWAVLCSPFGRLEHAQENVQTPGHKGFVINAGPRQKRLPTY